MNSNSCSELKRRSFSLLQEKLEFVLQTFYYLIDVDVDVVVVVVGGGGGGGVDAEKLTVFIGPI
jgi:hypothetical protein